MKRIKSLTNMRYTFFEYLDYWCQKIFLPNADSSLKWGIHGRFIKSLFQIHRRIF